MERKYAVILGNLGNTRDRFCNGYKDNPPSLQMLKDAASIPHVSGIELVGTWDIRPDNVRDMRAALADYGLKCVSVLPDLFANRLYWKGATPRRMPECAGTPSMTPRRCVISPGSWHALSSTFGPARMGRLFALGGLRKRA